MSLKCYQFTIYPPNRCCVIYVYVFIGIIVVMLKGQSYTCSTRIYNASYYRCNYLCYIHVFFIHTHHLSYYNPIHILLLQANLKFNQEIRISLPGSGTMAMLDIANTTSDVTTGRWCYRVDQYGPTNCHGRGLCMFDTNYIHI